MEVLREFEAVRVENGGDSWTISAEDGRMVRARYVVNATGLYADEVSRMFSAEE